MGYDNITNSRAGKSLEICGWTYMSTDEQTSREGIDRTQDLSKLFANRRDFVVVFGRGGDPAPGGEKIGLEKKAAG